MRPALDILGGVLATAALGALTWGLTIGSGRPAGRAIALLLVLRRRAAAGGFVGGRESARGARAMMPLAMFGSASFVGLTLLTLLLYGALGALMVLVPYVLIQASGYSAAPRRAARWCRSRVVLALASPDDGRAGRTHRARACR